MAGLLHVPLLMMTTVMVTLNLSLSPMLVHTLQNDTEKFSVQKIGAPEALQYAVSKYKENSDDLYQDVVVEVKDIKFQHEAAGTKYLFHVILDQSICWKSQPFFASSPLNDLLQRKNCHFEVYVEQLNNQMTLTSSKCNRIDPKKKSIYTRIKGLFGYRIHEYPTLPFLKEHLWETY